MNVKAAFFESNGRGRNLRIVFRLGDNKNHLGLYSHCTLYLEYVMSGDPVEGNNNGSFESMREFSPKRTKILLRVHQISQ
jgi:hypothetical protein